jgi:hypothetical protein
MITADNYRRYAAECVMLSQRSRNPSDKATLVEMAALWLRLAEFAERKGDPDNSPV